MVVALEVALLTIVIASDIRFIPSISLPIRLLHLGGVDVH